MRVKKFHAEDWCMTKSFRALLERKSLLQSDTIYRIVNLAFQLDGDTTLLREAAEGCQGDPPADVLLGVEARDRTNRPVDVAAALGSSWRVFQDTRNGETAGSFIAVRKGSEVAPRWFHWLIASLAGRDVQARRLLALAIRDHGRKRVIGVLHNPLKSTGMQDDAVRSARAWAQRRRDKGDPWALFGDNNMSPAAMQAAIGAAYSGGRDVMAVIYSPGWGVTHLTGADYKGTDHAVLTWRVLRSAKSAAHNQG